jgi:class 3 adenylate cyclase
MDDHDVLLDEGRGAYERHDWTGARRALAEAQQRRALGGADAERFAWSCRWSQEPDGFLEALERAEAAYGAEGDARGSARMALEQARHHAQMLVGPLAAAAYERALGYLADEPESPEHALAQWCLAFTLQEAGDLVTARGALDEALEAARRVGDEGVEALALVGLAHLAAVEGGPAEGVALLERAASLATRPEVAPIHAGHVFCATISVCRALCDWRRATQWTEVSTTYCDRESVTGYSGLCRFHQAEIDRLHGQLDRAEEEVLRATTELLRINRYAAGWAFSELVEIRVRRGDLAGADEALARAVELGSDGQPGRARLALARGAPVAALKSLERTLADPGVLARELRVFALPVHVAAALAAGATDAAARSVDELSATSARLGTDGPVAAAAVARGHLALHRGDLGPAIAELTAGVRAWAAVDAPYEAASARLLLARALHEDGDDDAARLELETALRTFDGIGAAVDADVARAALAAAVTAPRRTAQRCFLFSDIVGSTRLAEAMGDEVWEPLLGWHDRTLRAIFVAHGADEIKHGGDGFFVAVDDPDAAVDCAVAIQRALAEHRAAHGFAPAVRIGLHLGEATEREGDYYGGAVIRASRIADAAGAAEILVSVDLLDECARAHRVLERRDLSLKGIEEPVAAALIAWPDDGSGAT